MGAEIEVENRPLGREAAREMVRNTRTTGRLGAFHQPVAFPEMRRGPGPRHAAAPHHGLTPTRYARSFIFSTR